MTQVALIGVAGTVVTSLAGVIGSVRTAGIGTRSQTLLESQKSRRAAYSAAATALLAQRDATMRLSDVLDVPDLAPEVAARRVQQVREMQDDLGTAIGAAVIEGPEDVARYAEQAAARLGAFLDELDWWVEQGRPHHMRRNIVDLRDSAQDLVDQFTAACRETLRPAEDRPRRLGPLKRLRLRLHVRRHGGPYGWKGWR